MSLDNICGGLGLMACRVSEMTDGKFQIRYFAAGKVVPGLQVSDAGHLCHGDGIRANLDWKNSLGSEWRQFLEILTALANSRLDQISVEGIPAPIAEFRPCGATSRKPHSRFG